MTKRFQIRGDSNNHYRLSIGGVLLSTGNVSIVRKADGTLTLPRETMYSTESVTDTVARGFKEELEINVSISKFIGSLKTQFSRPDGTEIEKTTLYFLVIYESNSNKNQAEDEVDDEVIEIPIKNAIANLKEQKNEEFKILERII